jgi:hypothetical protein
MITYDEGGISVEYNSTVMSASSIAFMPRLHTWVEQNRQLSMQTVLCRNWSVMAMLV